MSERRSVKGVEYSRITHFSAAPSRKKRTETGFRNTRIAGVSLAAMASRIGTGRRHDSGQTQHCNDRLQCFSLTLSLMSK